MQLIENHPDIEKTAIGIDLGTTNSVVAISKDGYPRILRDEYGEVTMPSVVAYNEDGTVIVGMEAKNRLFEGDKKTVTSVKRLMGRSLDDIKEIKTSDSFFIENGLLKLDVGGHKTTPIEVTTEILKGIKRRAEDNLGCEVRKAVITVPAYFNDNARSATMEAAKTAGLEVLRLMNEPTAAALAYGLDTGAEGIYAVYDLGGGTFDISLLKLHNGVFQVLATGGHSSLGGDDFDRTVAEYLLKQAGILSPSHIKHMLPTARRIKRLLTTEKVVSGYYRLENKKFSYTIKRETFEQLIEPLVNKTLDLFLYTLNDAEIDKNIIQGVIMVGGATRVPFISRKVEEFTQKHPLNDVNPDEVVAMGAALQAERLVSGEGSDVLLLDVAPFSLGIETFGGNCEVLIPRNTALPYATSKKFTNSEDGQTNILIHVVQGEDSKASENNTLAKFELSDIPPMKKMEARVNVIFTVDENGLLTVTATEEITGKKQKVRVKPSHEFDIAEEILETNSVKLSKGKSTETSSKRSSSKESSGKELSEKEALDKQQQLEEEDILNQLAIEQGKATEVMDAAEFILEECGDKLSVSEQKTIAGGISHLRMHLGGNNIAMIKSARKILAMRAEAIALKHMSNVDYNRYFGIFSI